MHKLAVLFFSLSICFVFWLFVASQAMSDCFFQVSKKYDKYPDLYLAGKINYYELQRQQEGYSKENTQCEQMVVDNFILPPSAVNVIRGIIESLKVTINQSNIFKG